MVKVGISPENALLDRSLQANVAFVAVTETSSCIQNHNTTRREIAAGA